MLGGTVPDSPHCQGKTGFQWPEVRNSKAACENGVMATPKLSDEELQAALSGMKDWSVRNGKLHREYKFADFVHAFGFMATAAIAIEKKDHHPEWCNVYNRVTVDLTTHDSGGITQKDIALAEMLDKVAAKLA